MKIENYLRSFDRSIGGFGIAGKWIGNSNPKTLLRCGRNVIEALLKKPILDKVFHRACWNDPTRQRVPTNGWVEGLNIFGAPFTVHTVYASGGF